MDFSAARNAGLELAKGEWFLYVDDDEWFDDPTEIIEFFQTGEYMEYGFAQYTVRNYFDESFSKYSIGWVSRMIHRTPEMRFIHPVHEMFFPVYHPEKKFTRVFAHHVGYVFKNQEEREQHSQRNLPPLLKELERYPHNLRILMQIVQEYQFREEYETAEKIGDDKQFAEGNVIIHGNMDHLISPYIPILEPREPGEIREHVYREGQKVFIFFIDRFHEFLSIPPPKATYSSGRKHLGADPV